MNILERRLIMKEEKDRNAATEIPEDIYDISAAEETKKWAWLSNIHPLMIVTGIIVLVSIATYIIPGGNYERREVVIDALGGDTRELIIPGSFQFTESVPQGSILLLKSSEREHIS